MEHTDIYYFILDSIELLHKDFGCLLDEVYCSKYDLYQKKLEDLNDLEEYAKEKLRLNELSDVSERLRMAKENCKIKMNRYKQEEYNDKNKNF